MAQIDVDIPAMLSRFELGDMIAWRGHRFVISDVRRLVPDFEQLLLHWTDPDRLPLSVSAADLADATLISVAGRKA